MGLYSIKTTLNSFLHHILNINCIMREANATDIVTAIKLIENLPLSVYIIDIGIIKIGNENK